MQLFFKNFCGDGPGPVCRAQSVSGTEWFLIFTCMAILLAQLPNLNSVSRVSLLGAVTAIVYCILIWALPISNDRPNEISYHPLQADQSGMEKFGGVLNAIGIIVLAFRGHNVILEIQVISHSIIIIIVTYYIISLLINILKWLFSDYHFRINLLAVFLWLFNVQLTGLHTKKHSYYILIMVTNFFFLLFLLFKNK